MATEDIRMLTAQELIHLRAKVDKTLPVKGTKEFQPTNSWLEKKQIQTALDERKFLLEEERVERLGSLTKADWDPELKVANVTCRVGRQWKQMGHEVGGKLQLFPEEALFLLETNWLELMYNGVAMSIQQGYSMLLGSETGCTFNEYQTYLHLVRQGYTLLRHSKSIRATRYERQIRLHQHSMGQKQRKKKDGDITEEIFVEDGIMNTEGQPGVANTSYINRKHGSVKEEQEIIDVEAVEIVDNLVSDRSGNTNTHQKQGRGENSRLSLQNGNLNGIVTKSQNYAKIVSAGKEDTKMRVNRKRDEKVSDIKVETVDSEIGSKIQSGSIQKGKEKDGSVGMHIKEGEFEVTEPLSGTGVIVTQESEFAMNGADLSLEKNRQCNKIELHDKNIAGDLNNEATDSGLLSECEVDVAQSRTSASTETVRESGADSVSEESGSRYMQSSKEENSSKSTSVSLTEVSKSIKHECLKSDEVTDIVFVDDSSASLDSNEKETVTSQKLAVHCSDIVDISDSSQISQHDLTVRIKSCDTENKTSSEISDDIEVLNLVETRENLDDEIVEINQSEMPSTSAIKSNVRSRRRNSRQSTVNNNVVKNEVIRNNTVMVKQDVLDIMEVETFTANVTRSSGVGQNERQRSNVVVPPEGRKVTSVQLKHNEVEITSNFIDISEDEGKYDPRCLTKKVVKSADYNEIEVVNLEDEEVKPEPSQENERMRILDSIPSIEGKFVIHVSVPDKSLLPPNVCPRKEDYYIQRWRLTAPNIGGKPESDSSNNRDHLRRVEQPFHVGGQINPWIQYPAHLGGGGNMLGAAGVWNNNTFPGGGGNMLGAAGVWNNTVPGGGGNMLGAAGVWNNNTFPLSGPFMNQHYQNQFSGAFVLQSVFNRAAAMLSALGNSALTHSGMFGLSPGLSIPHTRNQYNTHTWHYQTRPYYRRPYYKRRFPYRRYERTQYNSTSVGLGEQNRETQTSDNTNIISLKVEEEIKETKVKVPIKEDVVDEDVDVIECVSSSPSVKIDNDTMEWNSLECPQSSSNTNEPEMHNMGKRQKRRGSGNLRFFNPPKKLKGFREKLRSDSLEESRRNIYLKEEAEISKPNPEVLLQEDIPATDVKTWRDLKTVLQVVVLDSSSEDEEDIDDDIFVVDDIQEPQIGSNLPLVQPEDCRDIGSILKKLQIIKPVNTEQEKSRVVNEKLRISFDLYMPSTSFRKASPGLPNYRISVVGYQDPIPEPREVVTLLRDFEDDVPVLFAVVLPDTVTFLQFGSIQLPVESFCL